MKAGQRPPMDIKTVSREAEKKTNLNTVTRDRRAALLFITSPQFKWFSLVVEDNRN